jgi:hypothetical protein
MARTPRPWFWKGRGGWYVTLNGRRVRLADGKPNGRLAEDKSHELMVEARPNPAPESDRPTVVSIIEAYLKHARRHLDPRSIEEQRSVLQRFAETHGFGTVVDWKPFLLTRWLDENPDWKNVWILRRVATTVKRAFNWAAKPRMIADLYARGLQDRILLIACGEMGRTPRLNPKGGRDHWGGLGRCCWSAAARRAGSSAAPTRTPPRRSRSRSRAVTSSARSCTSSSTWANSGSSRTSPASSPGSWRATRGSRGRREGHERAVAGLDSPGCEVQTK